MSFRVKRINTLLKKILIFMILCLIVSKSGINSQIIYKMCEKYDIMSGFYKKVEQNREICTFGGKISPFLAYFEEKFIKVNNFQEYPQYVGYMGGKSIENGTLDEKAEQGGIKVIENGELDEKVTQGGMKVTENGELDEKVTQGGMKVTENGTLDEKVAQILDDSEKKPININNLAKLSDVIKKYYTITSITELTEKQFNLEMGLKCDMTMQGTNDKPQILIFHTHSMEGFADSVEGDISTGIVGVGDYLAKILSTKYGYNVIHDRSVYDYVNGKLDRSKAYTYAEAGIEKILKEYPSIEVIIDLHRDGVDEDVHLVTDINGKKTAKVMLFNGISHSKLNGDLTYLPNPYIQENLSMSLQLKLLGEAYYPDFLRKNYINAYRYCLHYREKSMLIEAGAQNNTFEEEINAMDILAELLHRMFEGEKGYIG